ncbi:MULTISPECIES: type IV toxin-antitoxin system AbiEi family antitoxin [unclassified Rathayibacter]|uniref:type IV toxin-antitoxin system AbiEi family antitoxin n=1 Tax=unclassified Rathayibacter TaxID=2609250 RepID=UPI00105288A3|nr:MULTISPECIES: type IV toxin-antitoxin system AbiEi family antitoxin [unclassified Rathayibacter]TCL85881.1 transcriptional regulator with AbiEi antitoxin domain of type IV toxin-antitoxin system [Rathayibacter sp. PhB192]TCM31702.1 transcriptional regulator with AbiEi antitoxin domain of type IV toxin-antitoxin system [Rathayibacter sp. PhB179]
MPGAPTHSDRTSLPRSLNSIIFEKKGFSPSRMKTVVRREKSLLELLRSALPEEASPRVDAGRVVVGRPARWSLVPVWIGEGLPADVRRARERDLPGGRNDVPVFLARGMSPGARALLHEQGASWADESGSAVIRIDPDLLIVRLPPERRRPPRVGAWSAARLATAEAALAALVRGGGGPGGSAARAAELVSATGFSYQQTSKALAALDAEGYTAKVGPERGRTAGREFRDPGRLLSDWAGHSARAAGADESRQFHVPWRDVADSLDLVERTVTTAWCASGSAAADRLAPFLTRVPDLLIRVTAEDFDRACQDLSGEGGAVEVETGGRIHLLASPPQILASASSVQGVTVASPVRVYADLLRAGGRSADAAEFLRERVIGF